MNKSRYSLSASFLMFALFGAHSVSSEVHPALAQAKKAVKAPAKPNSLNGIQETRLSNGLTVITKEVHSAPVVYFSVWYKTGSGNEQVGQTGMSHLLEHMMFKGTKTRPPGAISALLQENGAEFNASTFFDRTNYFETLASDRLDLAMQLEADRMVNSLFDEKQHQKEMSVVRSEYEGGENNPGTALSKAVRLAAFQVNPYRWQTIGFRSDIENISRDEMYAYYKNYYEPNNATLVIVGDFNTKEALAKVQKYFGGLPSKHIQQHFITPEPPQVGERRVVVRRAGTVPQVEIAYHIPAFGTPDRYALDVLESALASGRTSRLFTDLVQSGLASSAESYDYGLRNPDLLFLDAVAQPGKTNAQLEKALLEEVHKLQTTPISHEELQRIIKQSEAGYIYGHDSVESQGGELGENAMRGDWRYGETYLTNLRRVTPADVQRVARKYLVETNRTVGYFEPILGKAPLTEGPPPGSPQAHNTTEGHTAVVSAPAQSSLSGTAPIVRANAELRPTAAVVKAAIKAPASQSATKSTIKKTRVVLRNGLTIVVQENHANPTVAVSGALLSAGGIFDPANKSGLASFTASQLSRGTKTRSLLDIARTLEGVGASVEIGGGDEYASIGGRSLTRDFGTMITIMADELRNPSFPADELEKARQQTLAGLEEARQDTGTLGQIAFTNAIYPKGHPYHSPTLAEQTEVTKQLTRDDLVAFHQNHYAPNKLVLTVVGDVNTAQVIATLQKAFGDWAPKANLPKISIPDVGPKAGQTGAKPIVINVPDKAQADVFYGYAGHLKRSDPDFYRVVVMNTILGGGAGLTSRLAVNVRDRLGLVYGIYAGTQATLGDGPFIIQFGSNPKNVNPAVTEMRRQVALAHTKGFTKEEVSKAIAYITGSYPVTLSTNAAVSGQLLVAEVYGLGSDYIQKRNGYYKAVTPAQVNAAAAKYLDPTQGTLVIAGSYPVK